MRGVKRERIIRVLLNEPGGAFTKYRIAKEAEVSIGWTMEYLRSLETAGYIEGTTVVEPGALLEHWAGIARTPDRFDMFHPDPVRFLSAMDLDYALTTYRAENLTNTYLFPSRTDLYVRPEDVGAWKTAITRDGLAGKGNLRLLVADGHVFYRKRRTDGLWIVSLPQLLLDLRREGGVCMEAYEMMVGRYVR